MADHIFDITDMNNYQRDTENKLNSQISSLTAKKTQLAAKLSTAKSKLSSAQVWNSNSENTSKIDTGPIEAEINQLESDISTIDGQVGELNTAITDTREFIRNLINTVTTTDGNYSKTLKQMNDSIKAYTDKMGKMSENFKNMGLTSKNEDIRKLTLNFSSDLQKNFSKAFNLNEGAVTTVKEVFLEGLPQDLKSLITIDDLIATDDGFAMCTKELSSIFTNLKYNKIDNLNVNLYYNDWYLYGIADINTRNTIYSILKLRTLDLNPPEGKSPQDAGIAIPFIEIDVNQFKENNSEGLGSTVSKVIYGGKKLTEMNRNLARYFSNIENKGAYLIADAFVNKVINVEGTVLSTLKGKSGTPIEMDRLIKYISNVDGVVYDSENHTLTISNPSNLSQEAKRAILAIRSGNTSYNSFSLEAKYHADMALDSLFGTMTQENLDTFVDKYGSSFFLADQDLYMNAIISDSNPESGAYYEKWLTKLGEFYFFNDDSDEMKKQKEVFGDI